MLRACLALVVTLVALLAIPSAASALGQRLIASDGAPGDLLGASVAVQGDTVVVGAPEHMERRGAVYVFTRTGNGYTQSAKLTASDAARGDRLGSSVAIDGDTIVAGAPAIDTVSADANTSAGAVYTFSRTGAAARTETAKLTAPAHLGLEDNDRLGASVAISGDTIVAGAPFFGNRFGDFVEQGTVVVFGLGVRLDPSDGGGYFGDSVAIESGGDILVGAPANRNFTGAAYAYPAFSVGSGRPEREKLIAADRADRPGASDFGESVAIDGGTFVVGADYDEDRKGAVYVDDVHDLTFDPDDAGEDYPAGQDLTDAKLTASDGASDGDVNGDSLGRSVGIDGETIVGGAPERNELEGAVYTFARTGPAARSETAILTAPDGAPGDRLGTSVAIDGKTIVAGALLDDVGGNVDQGSAYVFFQAAAFPVASCTGVAATVVGSAGNDRLLGTPGDDVIVGLGGSDRIDGAGGDDVVCAGAGSDIVVGGLGDDVLVGGSGNDQIDGGAGDDRLEGGDGADRLDGRDGADHLDGGGDADRLFGNAGADELAGGDGADRLDGGEGADELDGGAGVDLLSGGAGDDGLSGGEGADRLLGGLGSDRLFGEGGGDSLFGGAGDDLLEGGDGRDRLVGDAGADRLFGGTGVDRLEGGADASDFCDGGADTDTANSACEQIFNVP